MILNFQHEKDTIYWDTDCFDLKQQEAGISTKGIAREHGISEATFYNWKSKYGGMETSDVKRLKDLEEENSRLKKMYANLAMELDTAKYIVEKKL